MLQRSLIALSISSLALTGVAAAQGSAGGADRGGNPAHAGSTLPGYPGGRQTRLSGIIVDALSYTTRSGERGVLDTGTNGNGGGGNNENGGGNNNNGGGGNGGGVERPLGIVSNGRIYLIDLPGNRAGLDRRLAGSLGRTLTVEGRVFERNGLNVVVVNAVV